MCTTVQFIYHLAYMCIYEDDTKDPISMEIQNGTPLNLDCAACPWVAAPAFLNALRKFLKEFNTRKRLMTLKTFHFAGVASMKNARHSLQNMLPKVIVKCDCFQTLDAVMGTEGVDGSEMTSNHIFETVEVWVAKMKNSVLILASFEKTTDHVFTGSVSAENRCRSARGSSKVSRGRSEPWQPRRGIDECLAHVYWWQAGVHRHIFHSPASRSSKNFYSQLTGSQGLLEDLMVLPPLVPAVDQESSKLIVCFRDDDSAMPPELLDRDLRDFGVRTNLQMRYSPWAVDMINGMGTCDKKTLKKSNGGPSYLVLSVKRLLFSTVLPLFLCLDGERCLVKKEGSPAGIVALFAASMAVMFTAALYHNI
ncbi:hypothetical protein SELMODRAFT_442927 [Selaginella moellendorffii]|uniref:DNA-directed RNA polymerase n=1 Tax=Selaginella moellendorffii TaxID=88036 RepID=D8RX87_SELML|nr:hypothetical protein SELMODRAFT_442927 [Selaginella moellendorffii]